MDIDASPSPPGMGCLGAEVVSPESAEALSPSYSTRPRKLSAAVRREEKEDVLNSLVKAIQKLESDLKIGGTCAALNQKTSDLLSDAVMRGDRKRVRSLLMEEPLMVNSLDAAGSTPLHLAAQQGDAKLGQDLIDAFCASVNLCDVNGNTPLDVVLIAMDNAMAADAAASDIARLAKVESLLRLRGGVAHSMAPKNTSMCSNNEYHTDIGLTSNSRDLDMSEPAEASADQGRKVRADGGVETLLLRPPDECYTAQIEFTDPNSSNPVTFRCIPEENVFYYEIAGSRRPNISKIEFGETPPRVMFPNIGTTVSLPSDSTQVQQVLENIRGMAERAQVPHSIPNVVQVNRRDTLHWNIDKSSMALVFMGLPGRGRTFVAQRLCRWLNWKGVRARLFSGQLTENHKKSGSSQALAVQAMIEFFGRHPGSVGVLGCNHSLPRDLDQIVHKLASAGVKQERVIFIDTCTTDMRVIRANVLGKPEHSNPKYDTEEERTRLRENTERVRRAMQTRYQSLSEHTAGHLSFIHLSTTTYPCKSEKVVLNKITGHLCQKLLFFLLNLHPASSTTYLVRTGECLHQVANKVGGDSELTASGWQHAAAVRRFFNLPKHRHDRMQVFSSAMKRGIETASCFRGKRFSKVQYKTLNEINAGAVDGMTTEQVREVYPDVWSKRLRDKYYYGWPKGESYANLNQRLEQVILDMHRSPDPVLVIGHLDSCRGLLAYVNEWLPELCVHVTIPQHCIYEFNYDVEKHAMHIVCHDISDDVAAAKNELISSTRRPRRTFLEAMPTQPLERDPPRLPEHIKDIMSANPIYHPGAPTQGARDGIPPVHLRSLSGDYTFSECSTPTCSSPSPCTSPVGRLPSALRSESPPASRGLNLS